MSTIQLDSELIYQLIDTAVQGMKNTFAADLGRGGTQHGAAVLTAQGNIYVGCSYKSDTRTLSLHGEQVALAHAACHREYIVRAIAIVSNESQTEYTYPCGLCKQLLYESFLRSQQEMIVIVANLFREHKTYRLDELIGSFLWPTR